MHIRMPKDLRSFLCCCLGTLLLLSGGCSTRKLSTTSERASLPPVGKVVVVGFKSALPEGASPDMVRSPISGTVVMGGPVPSTVADALTRKLFEALVAAGKYELVSPGQARGVVASIVDSDAGEGMDPISLLCAVGEKFDDDAVLAGYIYRWREREGSAFAANRPASAAFDLYLVRPSDGAILWRGKFDKTQRSLSENVFDAIPLFRGGGRWLKVDELAQLGLDDMLDQMPAGRKEIRDLKI